MVGLDVLAEQRNALLKVVDRIFGLEDHAVDCDHAVVRENRLSIRSCCTSNQSEAKPQALCRVVLPSVCEVAISVRQILLEFNRTLSISKVANYQ